MLIYHRRARRLDEMTVNVSTSRKVVKDGKATAAPVLKSIFTHHKSSNAVSTSDTRTLMVMPNVKICSMRIIENQR